MGCRGYSPEVALRNSSKGAVGVGKGVEQVVVSKANYNESIVSSEASVIQVFKKSA